MRKRTAWLLVVGVIAAYSFIHYYANPIGTISDTFNMSKQAAGHLARAESAQTPQEVIEHVVAAKRLLPQSGSISWWWSPENVNFEEIQARLDEIIILAADVSSFEIVDERYNTEMYAIHAEIEAIQETLIIF